MGLPQFHIQEDWNDVLERSGENIWVSLKRDVDSVSIRGFLQLHKLPEQRSEERFTIKSFEKNELTVECCGDQCTFVSPERTLKLHDKILSCCDISSSGGLGVCGSEDGYLWIWDTDTGETRRVLSGHVAGVETCHFFPSGVVVLSGGGDFMLKIWSATDGKCARTLTGHKRRITDTAIIETGRNIISTSCDGAAYLWDCGSGQVISSIASLSCPINKCDLTVDCPRTTSDDKTNDQREFGTNGKVLLLACEDGTSRLYDVHNKTLVSEFIGGCGPVTSCSFVDENMFVVGCENGTMMLFDIKGTPSSPLWTVTGSTSSIISLRRANTAQHIIAGYKNGSCVVVNIKDSPSLMKVLTGQSVDPITSIVYDCHSNIYTSCRDGCVRHYKNVI